MKQFEVEMRWVFLQEVETIMDAKRQVQKMYRLLNKETGVETSIPDHVLRVINQTAADRYE